MNGMIKRINMAAAMTALLLLPLPQAAAKDNGKHAGKPAANQSNAPAGTPHASSDRDFGRDRAEDVGNGKKKGVAKKEVSPKRTPVRARPHQ